MPRPRSCACRSSAARSGPPPTTSRVASGQQGERVERQALALERDQCADRDDQRPLDARARPWRRRGRCGRKRTGSMPVWWTAILSSSMPSATILRLQRRADREQRRRRPGRRPASAPDAAVGAPHRSMSLPRALIETGTPSARPTRAAATPSGQKNSASITSNGKSSRIRSSSGSSALAKAAAERPRRPAARRRSAAARPSAPSTPRARQAGQRAIMGMERQRPQRQADRRHDLHRDILARRQRQGLALDEACRRSGRLRSGNRVERVSTRSMAPYSVTGYPPIKPRVHRRWPICNPPIRLASAQPFAKKPPCPVIFPARSPPPSRSPC